MKRKREEYLQKITGEGHIADLGRGKAQEFIEKSNENISGLYETDINLRIMLNDANRLKAIEEKSIQLQSTSDRIEKSKNSKMDEIDVASMMEEVSRTVEPFLVDYGLKPEEIKLIINTKEDLIAKEGLEQEDIGKGEKNQQEIQILVNKTSERYETILAINASNETARQILEDEDEEACSPMSLGDVLDKTTRYYENVSEIKDTLEQLLIKVGVPVETRMRLFKIRSDLLDAQDQQLEAGGHSLDPSDESIFSMESVTRSVSEIGHERGTSDESEYPGDLSRGEGVSSEIGSEQLPSNDQRTILQQEWQELQQGSNSQNIEKLEAHVNQHRTMREQEEQRLKEVGDAFQKLEEYTHNLGRTTKIENVRLNMLKDFLKKMKNRDTQALLGAKQKYSEWKAIWNIQDAFKNQVETFCQAIDETHAEYLQDKDHHEVVVNDGVAPTAATSEPYVPVSRHTAPQSFSSCHKYHPFGELVLTSDALLRNLLVFGRDNADGEYSCYRGCFSLLNTEGDDGRPPKYLHPESAVRNRCMCLCTS